MDGWNAVVLEKNTAVVVQKPSSPRTLLA